MDAVSYVGIITTDAQLIIRAWDPWLAEATGLREEQVRHRPLLELFPEIEARGLLERLRRVLDEGTIEILAPTFHHYLIKCRVVGAQPHFEDMQQHVVIAPLRDDNGIRGLVIRIEDVTARCVRERELTAQLKSDDENIRLRAARLLATDSDDMTPLLDVMADTNWQVRKAAVVGMARKTDPAVLEQLRDVIRTQHHDLAKLNAALSALIGSKVDTVPSLIDLLADDSAEVRMYAALALGGIQDTRAVGAVVGLLDDADVNVRFHALEALGRIGSRDAAVPVARILEERDPYLSFAALDALAAIGEPSVAPAIIDLLSDEALAAAAADALGALGDENAAGAIARAFARSFLDVRSATGALHSIHRRFEDQYHEGQLVADVVRAEMPRAAIARLVNAAQQPRPEVPRTALASVLGWLEFEDAERVLAALAQDAQARSVALDALVQRGRTATSALVAYLDDADPDVRKTFALTLGRIGDWSATQPLCALLEDETNDVVIAAAAALGSLGDRAAFEPLLELVHHPNAAARHAAVSAINSIGHPDTAEAAQTLLESDDALARECGIRIAGYFGFSNCLSGVVTMLRDASEAVRRTAAEHLSFFDDASAREALERAADDEAASVRAAVMRALVHLDDAASVDILRRAMADRDARVRYQAVQSATVRGLAELLPELRALLADDSAIPVRIAAVEALAQLGDTTSVPGIVSLVAHPEPDLACAAVASLAAFPVTLTRRGLLTALRRDDERVRLTALKAMQADPTAFMSELRSAAAGDNERVAQAALETIARHPDDASVDALIELSGHPTRRDDVVTALSGVGEMHVARVACGLQHADANVRRAIAEALGRMRRPAASRALSSALNDADPTVRFTADQALRRLDMWHGMRRA